MTVFGIITEIPSQEGTFVFLLVLGVLVVFEYTFRALEVLAERHGYKDIFEKLKQELTILGLISFSVFIYQTVVGSSHSPTFEAFEMAHVIVLFIALALIFQAGLLVQYSLYAAKHLKCAIRSPFDDLVEFYNDMDQKKSSLSYLGFHALPSSIPLFPTLRSYIEYRIIEKFFLRQHPLPKGFEFSKYAIALFKHYVSDLSEVGIFSWFVVGCFVVINYVRMATVDSETGVKTYVCGKPEHDDGGGGSTPHHRLLSSGETLEDPGCLQYTLSYGLFAGFALFGFTIGLYIATSHYFDRIIEKILEWEGLKNTEGGRTAYGEFLRSANQVETKMIILSQRSLVQLEKVADSSNNSFIVARANQTSFQNSSFHGSELSKSPASTPQEPIDLEMQDEVDDPDRHKLDMHQYIQEIEEHKLKTEHHEELERNRPLPVRIYRAVKRFMAELVGEENSNFLAVLGNMVNDGDQDDSSSEASGGEGVITSSKMALTKEKEIAKVFCCQSPLIHFTFVQLALLLQCFYISIWSTQLMPLSSDSPREAVFVATSTALIVTSMLMLARVISQTVMIHAVIKLRLEIVHLVCVETIDQRNVLDNMRRTVIQQLEKKSKDPADWRKLVKEKFDSYDDSGDGRMDRNEFRMFLGSLNIFMPKERFDIVWDAVDYDLSGAITWDELFVLVFPQYQKDMHDEQILLESFREKLKDIFTREKVPKSKRRAHLEEIFKRIDVDNSNFIEKEEFKNFTSEIGFGDLSEQDFSLLFMAADKKMDGKISFPVICEILGLTQRRFFGRKKSSDAELAEEVEGDEKSVSDV